DMLAAFGTTEMIGCGSIGSGVGKGVSGSVGGAVSSGSGTITPLGSSVDGTRFRPWDGQFSIRGSVVRTDTGPLYIVDGAVVDPVSSFRVPKTGRFGFAVSCESQCTPLTDRDGTLMYTYYRYESPPPIIAVRAGSPA